AEALRLMTPEHVLVAAVQAGGARQDRPERCRVPALAAAGRLREGAADNALLARIKAAPPFPPLDLDDVLDPRRYIGRSAQQVDEFLAREVEPIRRRYPAQPAEDPDDRVRV